VLVIAAVVAVTMDAVVQLVADVVTDRIVPSAELVAAVDAGEWCCFCRAGCCGCYCGEGVGQNISSMPEHDKKK
jgi:hypothetical protein